MSRGPDAYDITFSVGLIEKLAGIKKPEKKPSRSGGPAAISPPPLQPRHLGQLSAVASPHAQHLIRSNAQLSNALGAAKEVNGLLLRHEAQEVEHAKQHAQKLVKQYSVQPKAVPCAAEREACTQCLKDNSEDASRCKAVAEAYSACALSAFRA